MAIALLQLFAGHLVEAAGDGLVTGVAAMQVGERGASAVVAHAVHQLAEAGASASRMDTLPTTNVVIRLRWKRIHPVTIAPEQPGSGLDHSPVGWADGDGMTSQARRARLRRSSNPRVQLTGH